MLLFLNKEDGVEGGEDEDDDEKCRVRDPRGHLGKAITGSKKPKAGRRLSPRHRSSATALPGRVTGLRDSKLVMGRTPRSRWAGRGSPPRLRLYQSDSSRRGLFLFSMAADDDDSDE